MWKIATEGEACWEVVDGILLQDKAKFDPHNLYALQPLRTGFGRLSEATSVSSVERRMTVPPHGEVLLVSRRTGTTLQLDLTGLGEKMRRIWLCPADLADLAVLPAVWPVPRAGRHKRGSFKWTPVGQISTWPEVREQLRLHPGIQGE